MKVEEFGRLLRLSLPLAGSPGEALMPTPGRLGADSRRRVRSAGLRLTLEDNPVRNTIARVARARHLCRRRGDSVQIPGVAFARPGYD